MLLLMGLIRCMGMFLVLLLGLHSPASAEVSYPYQLFTTRDGLPSPDLYFVYQDQDGYIWTCTDRGVSRYNGYEFENFTASDGLTYNTVFGVFAAPDGDLYMPCYDGSISIWDRKEQKFRPFPHNDFVRSYVKKRWVWQILFEEDDIYVVPHTRGDTLFRFSRSDTSVREVISGDDFFVDEFSLDEKKICLRWVGDQVAIQLQGPWSRKYMINHFYVRSRQEVVFAYQQVLYLLNTETGSCQPVYQGNSPMQSMALKGDQLYLAFLDGVRVVDLSTWEVQARLLPGLRSTWLTFDREGNLWVSVEKKGLIKVSNLGSLETYASVPDYLQDNEVMESIVTLAGHIVIGTNQNRVLVLNQSGELINRFSPIDTRSESGYISVISNLTRFGDTVYSSYLGRLWEQDGGFVMQTYPYIQTDISRVSRLPQGAFLLFGSSRVELVRWGDEMPYFQLAVLPFSQRILASYQDESKSIWMAGHSRLFRVDHYQFDRPVEVTRQMGLPAVSVRSITGNRHGLHAFATLGFGLMLEKDDRFLRVDQAAGLVGDVVNTVHQESDSVLWCGSNSGLSRIELDHGGRKLKVRKITNYTTADGLPSRFIKSIIGLDGKLWVLSDNGIFSFRPEQLHTSFIAPELHLVSVRTANNKEVRAGASLSSSQNDLTFSFLGISHLKPEDAAFYHYRLVENDQPGPWRRTSDRSVWLHNLPAADLRLEIKAVNKNGVFSPVVSFPFTVNPHFTQTWWFRVVVVAIIIGVLWYAYRTRLRRVTQQVRTNRQLRDAQIRVKQAELSLLRNQMNPHFIFNALTSVQKYILKKDVKRSIKYLSRFSLLMRNTLEYSSIESISLQAEVDFISNYLEIEKTRFQGLFDYRIEVDPELNPGQVALPALLTQPVLENCVKHAFKDRDSGGEIVVSFERDDAANRLVVEIADNGRGLNGSGGKAFRNGSKHQSFGLAIVKERIAIMNLGNSDSSHFSIHTRADQPSSSPGTLAKFELPWQPILQPN